MILTTSISAAVLPGGPPSRSKPAPTGATSLASISTTRSIAKDLDEWAGFHALGKPALIGEFHFGSSDRGLFWEGLVGAGRESERGPSYARYLRAVADNPDFVGAHWFQYIDEPLTGRTLDGENAHIGFVTVADLPYADFAVAARNANLSVLRALHRITSRGASE